MKRTATKQVGKMRNNDIPGRKTEEQIDNEHMDAFEEKYDRLPRGNKSKNREPPRQLLYSSVK